MRGRPVAPDEHREGCLGRLWDRPGMAAGMNSAPLAPPGSRIQEAFSEMLFICMPVAQTCCETSLAPLRSEADTLWPSTACSSTLAPAAQNSKNVITGAMFHVPGDSRCRHKGHQPRFWPATQLLPAQRQVLSQISAQFASEVSVAQIKCMPYPYTAWNPLLDALGLDRTSVGCTRTLPTFTTIR